MNKTTLNENVWGKRQRRGHQSKTKRENSTAPFRISYGKKKTSAKLQNRESKKRQVYLIRHFKKVPLGKTKNQKTSHKNQTTTKCIGNNKMMSKRKFHSREKCRKKKITKCVN